MSSIDGCILAIMSKYREFIFPLSMLVNGRSMRSLGNEINGLKEEEEWRDKNLMDLEKLDG